MKINRMQGLFWLGLGLCSRSDGHNHEPAQLGVSPGVPGAQARRQPYEKLLEFGNREYCSCGSNLCYVTVSVAETRISHEIGLPMRSTSPVAEAIVRWHQNPRLNSRASGFLK
jgi:hypothetical protein